MSPNQILLNGKAPGAVSLVMWDESGQSQEFDVNVDIDIRGLADQFREAFPDQPVKLEVQKDVVVLSGPVSSRAVADKMLEMAKAASPKTVSLLAVPPPVAPGEVLLQVKFAEVDRTAALQLGTNFFTPGTGHTTGVVSTGQFGGSSVSTSSATTTTQGNVTTTSSGAAPPTINITNPLNLFLFRSDINFGAVVEALQNKSLLQILAEPNLIAVNGKEASFLAGGQFPFPMVQPGNGFTAVTIAFKDFGVKLNFTPVIMPNGNIHLKVAPEVSTLDFANALSISGFTVPALSTRKAETEFELQDGQSFVIAGLLDNRVTDLVDKIPGLGDIPILGYLFKSKNLQKSKSELMVLCTVHRISSINEAPGGPTQPQPFLDQNKFDGKKPSGGQK